MTLADFVRIHGAHAHGVTFSHEPAPDGEGIRIFAQCGCGARAWETVTPDEFGGVSGVARLLWRYWWLRLRLWWKVRKLRK